MRLPNIIIELNEQVLSFHSQDKLIQFPISSAKNGPGQKSGSEGTPLGKHYVRAKIGAGLPKNSVFVGRRATGEIYSANLAKRQPNRDWILSRILWLCGTEAGFNRLGDVDSMQRYIYIHGTPDTEPMGTPLSHGCIRMRNDDVIQLFANTPYGTIVQINQ